MLAALAALLIFQAASAVSCRARGTLQGLGRGRQKVFSGPCELLAGLQAKMVVQSDSLCAWNKKKKKGADFKFTLGFKIYYVFQLSSLHNWNFLPLIIFYRHSSTTGGLTSKIALQGWGLLRAACFYCFPHQLFLFSALIRFPSHTPSLTSHLPLALIYVFIPLISLFKMYGKALDWAPRDLSSIPGFSAFSIPDLERDCFVLSLWPGLSKD